MHAYMLNLLWVKVQIYFMEYSTSGEYCKCTCKKKTTGKAQPDGCRSLVITQSSNNSSVNGLPYFHDVKTLIIE